MISIFDDLKVFFNNINKIKKKNTKFYFFGGYNDYPYDIKMRYVDLNMKKKILQTGWNIWSVKTMKKHFGKKKFKKHYFNIRFDLKKDKNDLVRSWTIKIGKKKIFYKWAHVYTKSNVVRGFLIKILYVFY